MSSKFYAPTPAKGYEWINCEDEVDYERLLVMQGSMRGNWTPIAVQRVAADSGKTANEADFPWLGSQVLILRHSAVTVLSELLEANGELLPLATNDGVELFVYNAQTVDALDVERSEIVRFPQSERIMLIKHAAFHGPQVEGRDIFRLPHRGSPVYVSDRFVRLVRAAKLRGLKFVECSSS